MEPTTTLPPVAAPTPSRGLFGTNIPSSVTSIFVFLLFLLPFTEIRCTSGDSGSNNIFNEATGTAFSNSGMGLALGLKWQSSFGAFGREMNIDEGNQFSRSESPNYFAMIAWILSLVTVVLCIVKWKWGAQLSIFSATLSLAALVGLYFDLRDKVKEAKIPDDTFNTGTAADSFKNMGLELVFTAWYYAAIVLLAATVVLALKRSRIV